MSYLAGVIQLVTGLMRKQLSTDRVLLGQSELRRFAILMIMIKCRDVSG